MTSLAFVATLSQGKLVTFGPPFCSCPVSRSQPRSECGTSWFGLRWRSCWPMSTQSLTCVTFAAAWTVLSGTSPPSSGQPQAALESAAHVERRTLGRKWPKKRRTGRKTCATLLHTRSATNPPPVRSRHSFNRHRSSVDETSRKERPPLAGRRSPQLLFPLNTATILSIATPCGERATRGNFDPVGIDEDRTAITGNAPVVFAIVVRRAHDQLHCCRSTLPKPINTCARTRVPRQRFCASERGFFGLAPPATA